jgi:hypothetical protein
VGGVTTLPPGPGVEIVGHCEGCTGEICKLQGIVRRLWKDNVKLARTAEESP